VVARGNTICHNDGANIAVLDNSDPICDGNCLTNGAGRGLVIMVSMEDFVRVHIYMCHVNACDLSILCKKKRQQDSAKGTYRFNMIRNSELAGVYVGRQASPEMVANCVCDGKAAGILFEDEATGVALYVIVVYVRKIGRRNV
jgi:hypothetical protein